MATKTFDELKQLAIQIRDEKTNKQNTANRVGAAMLEAVNKLEQDYYDKTNIDEQAKNTTQSITNLNTKIDKRTTEYNVSVNNPTSGTNGGNKYDLSTAIGQVPAELRTAGLKVSFLNSAGKPESWKYQGGSWAVANFIQESSGGNKILTWVTDAATTRKQVLVNERKEGMMITYKNADGQLVNEQYKSTNYSDSEWVKDSNWIPIVSQYQLSPIEARTGYVVCSTGGGISNKIVTKQNFELNTKCRLIIKMTYSNTIDLVTLNVNNTGNIPLFINNVRASRSNSWDAGDILDVYYDGENYQAIIVNNFNKIIPWNTDVETTRNQVPLNKRKEGLQISYKYKGNEWIHEQYIGTSFTDIEWPKDKNWFTSPFNEEVVSLPMSNTERGTVQEFVPSIDIPRGAIMHINIPEQNDNSIEYSIYYDTEEKTFQQLSVNLVGGGLSIPFYVGIEKLVKIRLQTKETEIDHGLLEGVTISLRGENGYASKIGTDIRDLKYNSFSKELRSIYDVPKQGYNYFRLPCYLQKGMIFKVYIEGINNPMIDFNLMLTKLENNQVEITSSGQFLFQERNYWASNLYGKDNYIAKDDYPWIVCYLRDKPTSNITLTVEVSGASAFLGVVYDRILNLQGIIEGLGFSTKKFASLGDSIISNQISNLGGEICKRILGNFLEEPIPDTDESVVGNCSTEFGNLACGWAALCDFWKDGENKTNVRLLKSGNVNGQSEDTAYNVLSNQVLRLIQHTAVEGEEIVIMSEDGTSFSVPSEIGVGKGFTEDIPEIIYISIGTNDSWDRADVQLDDWDIVINQKYNELKRNTFPSAMRWALESLKIIYPSSMIFVCTVLPKKNIDYQITQKKNDMIKKVCKYMGVYLIDQCENAGISSYNLNVYLSDNVHPSNIGKELLVNYNSSEIKKFL